MDFLLIDAMMIATRGAASWQDDLAAATRGIQGQGGPGCRQVAEPAQQLGLPPNRITQWRSQLVENAAGAFGNTEPGPPSVDVKVLHAKIGELTLENDFRRCAHQSGFAERKAMIDRHHALR